MITPEEEKLTERWVVKIGETLQANLRNLTRAKRRALAEKMRRLLESAVKTKD